MNLWKEFTSSEARTKWKGAINLFFTPIKRTKSQIYIITQGEEGATQTIILLAVNCNVPSIPKNFLTLYLYFKTIIACTLLPSLLQIETICLSSLKVYLHLTTSPNFTSFLY